MVSYDEFPRSLLGISGERETPVCSLINAFPRLRVVSLGQRKNYVVLSGLFMRTFSNTIRKPSPMQAFFPTFLLRVRLYFTSVYLYLGFDHSLKKKHEYEINCNNDQLHQIKCYITNQVYFKLLTINPKLSYYINFIYPFPTPKH